MNSLIVLDYYVWKIFIMRIKPSWFKSRLLSVLSLIYVSIFPLPRKFLLHYFGGTGSIAKIHTRDLIIRNQGLLEYLKKEFGDQVKSSKDGSREDGSREDGSREDGSKNVHLFIGQHLLSNPNHRYSVGSIHLNCRIEGELLHISMHTQYRFSGDNDRVTRYLHQWLNAFREKGTAANFNIEGNAWTLSTHELLSLKVLPRHRKYVNYNILYI